MNIIAIVIAIIVAGVSVGHMAFLLLQKNIDKDRAALTEKMASLDAMYSHTLNIVDGKGTATREERISRLEAHIAVLDMEITKGEHDQQGMFLIHDKKVSLMFKLNRLYDEA